MKLSLDIDSWCEVFASQAEASGHVFWVSQLDYQKHLFVSPSFQKIWGYAPETLYEHVDFLSSTIISNQQNQFKKYCIDRHNKQNKGQVLYQIKSANGDTKCMSDRFMTLYHENGTPLASAGICMDVTGKMDLLNNKSAYQDITEQHNNINNQFNETLKEKLKLLTEYKQKPIPMLTAREKECLYCMSQGLSARETADKLYISRRTVEKHIDNAKFKFNCTKKIELLQQLIDTNALA